VTEYLFLQAVNGLVIGLVYALMALGLTLIFSVSKVVNFAHGEVYMLGAYASYYLASGLGLHPVPAVLGSMAAGFLIGAAVERAFLRPLYTGRIERKDEYAIFITFGLSIFLQNLALYLFGPWTRRSPSFFEGTVSLGSLSISSDRVTVSGLAIVLMLVFLAVMSRTFIGKGLRAVSQDRDAAAIAGINPLRMNLLTFGTGSALAAAAGALMGPIFLIFPTMGTMPVIKGFVIIVLGGMGSVRGTIIAAILLGEVESLGSVLIPDMSRGMAYKNAFGLILLSAVLLVRPTGLFGEKHVRME
jgi:branched-chain amino acid transport system permease protein